MIVRIVGKPSPESDAAIIAYFKRLLELDYPGFTWEIREPKK